MKRIILMVTVALVMALMLALSGPALATIHPLSNSECSGLGEDTVAGSQDPPGISPEDEDTVGSDPDLGPTAQPIISVVTAQGEDSPAFKTEPSPTAEEQEFCPA
jgi:hypothetical protein